MSEKEKKDSVDSICMLTVQCPNCKQRMKTNPKIAAQASKRCVYCGKSFKLVYAGGNRIVERS